MLYRSGYALKAIVKIGPPFPRIPRRGSAPPLLYAVVAIPSPSQKSAMVVTSSAGSSPVEPDRSMM